jgi:hypothetical protein
MLSGAEGFRKLGFAVLGLAGAGLLVLAGCGDRGPTNIYSEPLFGVKQSGAQMQVWSVEEDTLSSTSPTAGLDGFVVWMKNTGPGGTIGPIQATLTLASPNSCATITTYGAAKATAVFGTKGEVINPGDVIRGQAVDASGNVQNSQYAYEVQLTGCASVDVAFTVTASDPRGSSWTSGFTGLAQ